jgi:MFS family permease
MEGIGTVMISIMAFTLIGDLLPSNRKVKAISWVVAAGFASTLIVTPLIDLITKIEGWRYTFLLPLPPVIIAVLIFSSLKIHSKKVAEKINPTIYLEKFKQVFQNKSALSFLIGTLFFTGAGSAAFIFAFLRQQFLIPREYIVYIIQIASVIFIIGSIMVGKIGNRFGSKKLAVIGSFGSGICLILLFFSPNVWLALAFNFLQVSFTAISLAAYPSLAVDQIQHSRSTIMSLTRVFSSIGNTITPAIGGSLLVLLLTQSIESGYQAVGLTFGVMNIISAIIIYILTKDPLLIQKPKILNPQSNTDTSVEA